MLRVQVHALHGLDGSHERLPNDLASVDAAVVRWCPEVLGLERLEAEETRGGRHEQRLVHCCAGGRHGVSE